MDHAAVRGLSRPVRAVIALGFGALAAATGARASDLPPDSPPGDRPGPLIVHVRADGVAANGLDPVALLVRGEAIEGNPDIIARHDGAIYRFESARNRALFLTDPAAFLPRYGGYDALGVRAGHKIPPGRNMSWQVDGERIYFFRDAQSRADWNADPEANRRIADAVWPEIRTLDPDFLSDPSTP